MINIVTHFFFLLFAAFAGVIIYSLSISLLYPVYKFSEAGPLLKILSYPFLIVFVVVQYGFWIAWSAYCVIRTVEKVQMPEVTHCWIYWLVAWYWSTKINKWFVRKELANEDTRFEDRDKIINGALINLVIGVVTFVSFSAYLASSADYSYKELFLYREQGAKSNLIIFIVATCIFLYANRRRMASWLLNKLNIQ